MTLQDLPENQVPFWYQEYLGEADELDEDDYPTGDKVPSYAPPVRAMARISANTGNAQDSPFGQNIIYDKSISTVQKLPINEQTKLFIDIEPEFDDNGKLLNEPDYQCVCPKYGLIQNVWAIKKLRGGISENHN